MTRLEAFEKLAKNNGLNIEICFNTHRAWFNNKDYLMSLNIRDALHVATKVQNGKFIWFEPYKRISQKVYTNLDKQIKQLIGDFKVAQVEEKLDIMENDFE